MYDDRITIVYNTSLNPTEEIYNKPDNDPNNNDNNGGTTIYKAELNLENIQEKSRLKQNEFKRLLNGGEREIRTLEPFLTVTRFPVVRPRPTRRFLQKILNFTTLKLYLIYKALSNDIRRNSTKYA